jgi:hypothetical protein
MTNEDMHVDASVARHWVLQVLDRVGIPAADAVLLARV